MTSLPIHHLTKWNTPAVIIKELIAIGDCSDRMLIMVNALWPILRVCAHARVGQLQRRSHAKTWLPFNTLTLTMNPDNCKASPSSFSSSPFFLFPAISLISNVVQYLHHYPQNKMLSWPPAEEQLKVRAPQTLWSDLITSNYAETRRSPL